MSTTETSLAEALRAIPVFSDLTGEEVAWFLSCGEEVNYRDGERVFEEGAPAEHLVVLLEGEIHIEVSDEDGWIFIAKPGQVTGKLPFSRMTHYGGFGRAVGPVRSFRFPASRFPELQQRLPELTAKLVGVMADRIRETTRIDVQRDKLMALGKLSAGLAHELNNPAAASQRAACNLRQTLTKLRCAQYRLSRRDLPGAAWQALEHFEEEAAAAQPSALSSLERSDREEEIASWLQENGIEDAWQIAGSLGDIAGRAEFEALGAHWSGEALRDALAYLCSAHHADFLSRDIENSTSRISELVRAIKEYTYMDQASLQEADIHQGIENTLTMLGHKLKKGVEIVKSYGSNVPAVCAYGSDLNQLWTNLIDNAVDAMRGSGRLEIRTSSEPGRVLVEVIDNGPGIPADVQPRIFEPFFTTKGVGEGTGLGLDIARRIVEKHHGRIQFESQPGRTVFQVRLPLNQPRTVNQGVEDAAGLQSH